MSASVSATESQETGGPPAPTVDWEGLNCAVQNPVPSQGRLLTRIQYDNVVRDVFKGLVNGQWSTSFPAENEVLGFSTSAEFHRASPWLAEAQMLAAEDISGAVLDQLNALLPCAADASDEACAQQFLDDYAARAFRRPLRAEESEPLLEAYRAAATDGGFDFGIALAVQVMLQSPQFLYRLDASVEAPLTEVAGFQLSDFEIASKLSFFFWNSMPDEQLLERAGAGELRTKAQVEAEARRLVADSRTRATLLDFTRQWLGMNRFESLARVTSEASSTAFNADWQQSLESFIDFAYQAPSGGLDALFNSPRVFLNRHLAGLYGVAVPDTVGESEFFAVDLPGERFGILSQPGLMALLAHADQTAPVQRGVFIRDRLLCQPAPNPPNNVTPEPPDPDLTATTRERFAQHTAALECAACHRLIDGMGLPLEAFDNIGRYRTVENGITLDLSGEIFATRDATIGGLISGPSELASRLAQSSQVEECVVTQLYRYGTGRTEEAADMCSIAQAVAGLSGEHGSFSEMMIQMALSDAFRYRSPDAGEEAVQ